MGCCASTPSPYPTQGPSSSSRAITSSQPQSQAALPRPSTHASSHSNRQHHQHAAPLSTHINRPLKLHVWTSSPRVWTRKELDRERTEFFDTRVTGRPEIWQTIKGVLEVLWSGGDQDDTDGGLGTAQQILDAAGITIPTGDIANGAYDSLGAFYPVPEHIVSDPQNLVALPARVSDDEEDKSGEETAEEHVDEDEILRRREEKGKAVVNAKDLITIRAKLSDRDEIPVKVTISKEDSVRLVARKILEESDLSPPKHIRIAYFGKILKDNQTLGAQGWKDEHVLNALVFG